MKHAFLIAVALIHLTRGAAASALVHEFGHVLGFRDGYFRSYQDRGSDGYEIVEVILDPERVVAAPERGRVRREHFVEILGEKRR